MLTPFDWLRRAESGAELLATLDLLEGPDFPYIREMGPPLSAFSTPCQRCWIYPQLDNNIYCNNCYSILHQARRRTIRTYQFILVWGYLNRLPRFLETPFQPLEGLPAGQIYRHDNHRFLMAMPKRSLQPWLQELMLYHGTELTGFLQAFPTMGRGDSTNMTDVFCRLVNRENTQPMNQLWIRFYSLAHHVFRPHTREQAGLLTFNVVDFLAIMEMSLVFRSILRPHEQEMLRELLTMTMTDSEEQFYWGRFLGVLNQKAKDMLEAWKVRRWSHERVKMLYELTDYVGFVNA